VAQVAFTYLHENKEVGTWQGQRRGCESMMEVVSHGRSWIELVSETRNQIVELEDDVNQ
jgi:hypothetical protein